METLLTAQSLIPFLIGVVVAGVTYYFICKNQNSMPSTNITHKLISNAEALELIDNYSGCKDDDTVSGHLELDVLLTYIDQATTQCDSIGIQLSGLEYYFAKYKNDATNGDRSTIVIYPTYKDANNNHVPFDPFISTSGNPVEVQALNSVAVGSRSSDSRFSSRHVLDKSNMSPPRQNTI